MRASSRRRIAEDEEESVFVSMTDMTVSFLFIVMILLAFFASQLQRTDMVPRDELKRAVDERNKAIVDRDRAIDELIKARARIDSLGATVAEQSARIVDLKVEIDRLKQQIATQETTNAELQAEILKLRKTDPLEVYIGQASAIRRTILQSLRDRLRLDFPGLQVDISDQMDALRFKGDGLFQRGSNTLAPDKRQIVEAIATRLEALLPCYTLGPGSRWSDGCNAPGAIVEAVQIEGHTDSDGDANANIMLSTARADQTFFAMTAKQPHLIDHTNTLSQPVLSVAGYGKMRPVASNATTEGKATNRRIDLRIIMYTPQHEADINTVRNELRQGLMVGPPP